MDAALFFYTILSTKGGVTMYEYGYGNNYMQRLESMQRPSMQPVHITQVNGRNGAEAFMLPPNSNILLLDEREPIVWLKQTDGGGYATLTPYTITPYQEAPVPDIGSLEQRIERLEAMFNESHPANAQQVSGNAGAE